MSYKKQLIYLVIFSTLIRLFIAFVTEFGNDEVYYYTYALHLQWNYFDHPPGVAWLIKLTTLNLWLSNEVFVRLGAILCAAAGNWLSYKTGKLIRNERTGFYAALLYNTSIYTSIIAGTFILPDSPQVMVWLAAMFILVKMVRQLIDNGSISTRYWLLFGLLSGICIMCKVHGVFLWFGFLLYILVYSRKTLLQPRLYLSAFLTLLIISPIILWNINNHFVTWTFHSNRVAVHSFHIDISSFLQAFFGQLFYNNPVNVLLIVYAIYAFKTKRFLPQGLYSLFILTGLPIIIVVTLISLFNPVLPHWSGPGFMSLSFISAACLDKTFHEDKTALPAVLKISLSLIVVAITGGIILINFYPGTFGKKEIANYGSGDFTLDLSGWKNFAQQYSKWLQEPSDSNNYQHLKIVSDKWFPASHIEYYIALPTHKQVVGVGSLNNLHNFAWLNQVRSDLKKGDNALCIVPSNYATDMEASYGNVFSSITKVHVFTAERNGKTARYFALFLLKNYKATDEVHTITLH